MRTIRRGLLAATATVALTGVLAPTAYAERVVHYYAASDSLSRTYDFESGEQSPEVADPAEVQVDVVRTAVDHRAHNVVVTVRVSDLRRQTGDDESGVYVRFLTDESVRRNLYLDMDAGHPQGRLSLRTRNEDPVRCTDKSRSVDYAGDVVRLVVPRSCLSAPRWVRVGVGVYRAVADEDSAQTWRDDANRNGTIIGDVLLGARVRRA